MKKRVMIFFSIIILLAFGYFGYNAIPIKNFESSEYIILTKHDYRIEPSIYPVENIYFNKNLYKLKSYIGCNNRSLYFWALSGTTKNLEQNNNYNIIRYVFKNKKLDIAEVINLDTKSNATHKNDYPSMLHINPPYLYYYLLNSKKLIKYNIKTHQKTTLLILDKCKSMDEFDGTYIKYYSNFENYTISEIKNNKEINIDEFQTASLIPGESRILIYEEGKGNAYYDLKTGQKKYIKNVEIKRWDMVVDSGKKVIYSVFHTSVLRMLLTIFEGGQLWYYDIWLHDLETGKKERIYQVPGTNLNYFVISLKDYPCQ